MYCIGLTSISALAGKVSNRLRTPFVKHALLRGMFVAAIIALSAAAFLEIFIFLAKPNFLFKTSYLLLASFFLCSFELNRRIILIFKSAKLSFICETVRATSQIAFLAAVFAIEGKISIVATEVSIALSYIIGWILTAAHLREYLSAKLQRREIKIFSRWHRPYSTWGTGQVTLENIAGNAPLLIGVSFAGLDGAGLIRIAQSISNVLNIPVTGVQQIALAKSSLLAKSHGYEAAESYYESTSKSLAALLLTLSMALVPFASYIIGMKYGQLVGQQMLIISSCYCLIAVIAAYRIKYGIKLNLLRRIGTLASAMAFGAVSSVVLSALLPPIWGAMGIAAASVLTSIIILIAQKKLSVLRPAAR